MRRKVERRQRKVRVNLELTQPARARLERLVELSDADSMTEVVRRALVVYEIMLMNQAKEGESILVLADGTERRLVIS